MAITLWHVTKQTSAEQIREGGFRDGPFREMPELRGVYFADRPLFDAWDGSPPEWVGIAVILEDEAAVASYEVIEEQRLDGIREWFIPAHLANTGTRYFVKRG